MSDILIGYATRSGSTKEIADLIGELLQRKGVRTHIVRIEDIDSIENYQAVVLGSAIRDELWLPEAIGFVRSHLEALQSKPLFYFQVCMAMHQDTPTQTQQALRYSEAVRNLAKPVDIGLFGGVLQLDTIAPVERNKLVRKGFPEGDWRDWKAVQAWVDRLVQWLYGHGYLSPQGYPRL